MTSRELHFELHGTASAEALTQIANFAGQLTIGVVDIRVVTDEPTHHVETLEEIEEAYNESGLSCLTKMSVGDTETYLLTEPGLVRYTEEELGLSRSRGKTAWHNLHKHAEKLHSPFTNPQCGCPLEPIFSETPILTYGRMTPYLFGFTPHGLVAIQNTVATLKNGYTTRGINKNPAYIIEDFITKLKKTD